MELIVIRDEPSASDRRARSKFLRLGWIAAVATSVFLLGCSDPAQFRLNEVELLKIQTQQQAKDETLDPAKAQEVVDILAAVFGTPDQPRFPNWSEAADESTPIVELSDLIRAAGPVSSDKKGKQQGLYREHCAQCHGISGDGAGPTSAFLQPYPRDFRLGKFKYKSTKLGQRPVDEDLRRTIVQGIPGTGMPSFRTLPEEDVDALIAYVKYLTIRGRVEYKLLAELAVLPPEDHLIDWDLRSRAQPQGDDDPEAEEARAAYEDQLSLIAEMVFDELDAWQRAKPVDVPPIPDWLTRRDETFAAQVTLGRELFSGKANCAQCHGFTGLGDGQTENFDDWANQWLKGANVDARDPQACAPFIAAGAFPPRPLRPRNLRLRVYRGGDRYVDLYRRIALGIEGTGMPDSAALSEQEIWSLVAYVVDLPFETSDESAARSAAAHEIPISPTTDSARADPAP